MQQLLDRALGDDDIRQWAIALGAAALTFVALVVVRRLVRMRVRAADAHTRARWNDVVARALGGTKVWFSLALALWVGTRFLTLEPRVEARIGLAVLTLAMVQVGLWAQAAIEQGMVVWQERHGETNRHATFGVAINFAGRLLIWTVVLLLVLQNAGVEISALIAGLGVGGIAAGLALQSVMSDLFASLSIYTDRPFDIGDFIAVGELIGTVERIGLRSTRLKALSGEHLVIYNGDLTSSRIRNYKRMEERRIVFELGIVYGTPYEKVKGAAPILREVVEATEGVRFDRAHFKGYGDFALIYEVVYHVLRPEYDVYMDVQQAINLEVFRRFEDAGLEFAYPTQTLYLRNEGPPEGQGAPAA